jgi:hypothetical protein
MLLNWLSRFRKTADIVPDTPRAIAVNTLERAMALRHIMLICFTKNDNAASFAGPCIHIDQRHLLIDIGDVGNFARKSSLGRMIGENVLIRFNMKEGGTSYYQFSSRVRDVLSRHGRTELVFELPDELGSGQRRGFFRFVPHEYNVRVFRAWRLNDVYLLPLKFKEPELEPFCDQAADTSSIVNISAKGMFIRKPRDDEFPYVSIHPQDTLMTLLDLDSGSFTDGLKFFLLCKVVHAQSEESSLAFGVHFKAWTTPVRNGVLHWRQLDDEGHVVSLAHWVWRQQSGKHARRPTSRAHAKRPGSQNRGVR